MSSTPRASVVIYMFGTYNWYIIYTERRASKLFSSILDRPWVNRHCPSPTRFAPPIFKYAHRPAAGETSVVRPSLSSLLSMLYIFILLLLYDIPHTYDLSILAVLNYYCARSSMIDDDFSHWHPIYYYDNTRNTINRYTHTWYTVHVI